MELLKFSSYGRAITGIRNKTLRISLLTTVNDPLEWLSGINPTIDLRMLKQAASRIYGMLCFTSIDNIQNDYFWKEYGDNYSGLAIVYEIADECVMPINYLDAPVYVHPDTFRYHAFYNKPMADKLMHMVLYSKLKYGIKRKLINGTYLYSYEHWDQEMERRVYVRLPLCSKTADGQFYENLRDDNNSNERNIKLTKIVIGKNSTISIRRMEKLLHNSGLHDVIVLKNV